MEVLTDNKNSVDFDDSDIERQIEEELNTLNLDDIEDDDDDENTDNIVEDYGNDEVEEFDTSISRYLAFIQNNETRAQKIIIESGDIITNIDQKNVSINSLLKKKLTEELQDEHSDVLVLHNQVLQDLKENEKTEDEALDTVPEKEGSLPVAIITPGIIDAIQEIEEKAQNELNEMKERHAKEEERQKFLEEKRQTENEEFEKLLEERKKKRRIEMNQLKEEYNKQEKLMVTRLQQDLQNEEKQIQLFEEQMKENLENDMLAEKERLLQIKSEILANQKDRENTSAIVIQKHFRRHRVQKNYNRELMEMKEARLSKERQILEELLKEEEIKIKEEKRKHLKEEQRRLDEKRKIEKEKEERIMKYEHLKQKVKEESKNIIKNDVKSHSLECLEDKNQNLSGSDETTLEQNTAKTRPAIAEGSTTQSSISYNQNENCENKTKLREIPLNHNKGKSKQTVAAGLAQENFVVSSTVNAVDESKGQPKASDNVQNRSEDIEFENSKEIKQEEEQKQEQKRPPQQPQQHQQHGTRTLDTEKESLRNTTDKNNTDKSFQLDTIESVGSSKVRVSQSHASSSLEPNAQLNSKIKAGEIKYNSNKEPITDIREIGENVCTSATNTNEDITTTAKSLSNVEAIKDNEGEDNIVKIPDKLIGTYKNWLVTMETLIAEKEVTKKSLKKRRSNVSRNVESVTSNRISKITNEVNLEKMTSLELCDVTEELNLDTLPSICPQLQQISCSRCTLKNIHIEDLDAIQCLCIKHSKVLDVYLNLSHVRIVDFSNNNISDLYGFSGLHQLSYLDLSNNYIRRLSGIEGCMKLQLLNLDGNKIISTKGLKSLINLSVLSCQNNDIMAIDEICYCPFLVKLNVSGNNLTQVPRLKNNVLLCHLYMENNNINSIECLSQLWLPLLTYISLANNGIQEVSSLDSLTHLRSINLRNNLLSDAKCLDRLQSFEHGLRVCIEDNPVQTTNISSCVVERLNFVTETELSSVTQDEFPHGGFSRLSLSQRKSLMCLLEAIEDRKDKERNFFSSLQEVKNKIGKCQQLNQLCNETLNVHKTLLRDGSRSVENNQTMTECVKAMFSQERERTANAESSCLGIDGDKFAIKIQAAYRGYRVRKAYLLFLQRFRQPTEQLGQWENESDYDYEEVNLTEFDLDDVNMNWIPPDTPQLPLRDAALPDITTNNSDSYELSIAKLETKQAWVTPTAKATNSLMDETSPESLSSSEVDLSFGRSHMSEKESGQMLNDWGFHDEHTTEMMLKRAKKMGVRKKKKTLDAQKRYELFKKKDETLNRRIISPRYKRLPRESYFERSCTGYTSPQLLLDGQHGDTQQQMVFRWVCNQAVVHKDQMSDIFAESAENPVFGAPSIHQVSRHETTNTYVLPPLDSSVLAGRQPSLIQSKVHNPKPPKKKKARSNSGNTKRGILKEEPAEKSHSAPTRRSNAKSVKEEQWKQCSYR